jgi:predicted RNase H-like HicB family nuclease
LTGSLRLHNKKREVASKLNSLSEAQTVQLASNLSFWGRGGVNGAVLCEGVYLQEKFLIKRVVMMEYEIRLEAGNEGSYAVYVPSLSGCMSEGETIWEALENIEKAICLYLEPLEDDKIEVSK